MNHFESGGGRYLPWMILGLLGVGAGATLVPRLGGTTTRAPAPDTGARPAPAAPLPEGDEGGLAGGRAALQLLAEYLGVDAKADGDAGARINARLCTDGPCPPRAETGIGLSVELPRGSKVDRLWRGLVDNEANVEALIARLGARLDAMSEGLACPDGQKGCRVRVQFVVATLPDYVDSNSAWMFDPLLDAVQRAAGAAGYVLDRFHLPDWAPDAKTGMGASQSQRTHESEAGAVLFRNIYTPRELRQRAQEEWSKARKEGPRVHLPADLLMVLITPETPTFGIHKRAFLASVALAAAWGRAEPSDGAPFDHPLLILGPSFSGSTPSLMLALDAAARREAAGPPFPRVRIISGSATNAGNQERLTKQIGEQTPAWRDRVEFHSTSVADPDNMRALSDYLGSLDGSAGKADGNGWYYGDKVALVVESNTGWGRSLQRDLVPDKNDADRGSKERKAFPRAEVVTFPLHISRLRGAASARGRGVAASSLSAPGLALEMDERTPPRDKIPSITPEITAASVETVLAGLLDTLEKLPVTAIGILATDKRDHLFLAQEIARRCPDVLLFSVEPNLLYLNRDFRPYVRGMLVASSYPLLPITQRVSDGSGREPLLQFPMMGAQGVYNALLALLDRDDAMLDYRYRLADKSESWGPSVWLGVVGQDAIWPLKRIAQTSQRTAHYSWRPAGAKAGDSATSDDPIHLSVKAQWPRSTLVFFFSVGLALVLHALIALGVAHPPRSVTSDGRWTAWWGRVSCWLLGWLPLFGPPDRRARRWRARTFGHEEDLTALDPREASLRQEYLFSILACLGALWALVAWSGGLIRAGEGAVEAGSRLPDAFLPVLKGLGTGIPRDLLGVLLVVAAATALAPTQLRIRAGNLPLTVFRLLPVGVGLLALFWLRQLIEGEGSLWTTELAGFNALRMASFGSFVSPTSVILCFALLAYMWGIWNLRRLHLQATGFRPTSPVFSLLGGDDVFGRRAFLEALNQPALRLGFSLALALAAFVGVQATLGWNLGHTLDGRAMGKLIVAGSVFSALVVGHTLAHSVQLGRILLRSLRGLNQHPVGAAFGRIARDPFLWRFSLGIADGRMLAPLVRQAIAVGLAARDYEDALGGSAPPPPDSEGTLRRRQEDAGPPQEDPAPKRALLGRLLRVRAADFAGLVGPEVQEACGLRGLARDVGSEASFHTTATWSRLEAVTVPIWRALVRGPWSRTPYPAGLREAVALPSKPGDPPQKPGDKEAAVFYREAETFIALELAYTIRHVLVRLLSGLTVSVTGLLLLLCAHLFYSFQGRAYWLTVDWIALGVGTTVALALLVKLEKDAILSRLWSTRPGHVDWNGEFIGRMIVYGAIPVITLFVTFFPEVGSSLFAWLEPVRKVLPY
jgi:hypothetical protein